MITVDKLSKSFTLHILNEKKIVACRDISFHVPPGGFLGLSGPSGVGKSTVIPRVSALAVIMEPILARNGVSRDAARKRAIGLLERLRIPSHLFDAYPATFSGGEQQRINIARAVSWKPRLLLLDEPTASLDKDSVGVVLEILKELREEGTTMIGIFHDTRLLSSVTDSVCHIC